MTVKQSYEIGDTVWIYGINPKNTATKGKVIHSLSIPGYDGVHYIIAVPTGIEDLLEIRTWHNISQDEHGPVGGFRHMVKEIGSAKKFLAKNGMVLNVSSEDDDEPTEAEIHAALEKSRVNVQHQPLVLKENNPKRRNYPRKKKQ